MKRLRVSDWVVAGTCLLLCLVTMVLNAQSPVARSLLKGERISGLVIGSDYSDHARHSDTLMYVSYDSQSRFLDVLSIPRDTSVSIPELPSVRRVNEIFAYEFHHAGRDFNIASMALKGYVETLLSSGAPTAVEIPFYFTVDYKSFRALIDAIGGIYIKVVEPMHYDDNWGKLHIHFEPGTYLMDGKTALLYVRYRGASADHGRVFRQQIFLKEMIQRLKSPMLIWNLPKYAPVVLEGIHTNFSVWDLFSLLLEGRRVRWKDIRLLSVPGRVHGSLWKMNPKMTRHITEMMKVPVPQGGPSVQEQNRKALVSGQSATVEVWNASDRSSLTQGIVQFLRDQGFDVVKHGPFHAKQQRTLVIDRSGKLRPAQAVAEVLRVIHPEVISRVDLSRQVDVSLILGNDARQVATKGLK